MHVHTHNRKTEATIKHIVHLISHGTIIWKGSGDLAVFGEAESQTELTYPVFKKLESTELQGASQQRADHMILPG